MSVHLLRYVIIRDLENETAGFMVFRAQEEEARIIVQAKTPGNRTSLRALLVSGLDAGAALDLGLLHEEGGQITLEWQGATRLALWDAVALVEDWPLARLYAAGMMGTKVDISHRQLAEAAADFLKFPQTDALLRAAPPPQSVLGLPL